VCWDLSSEFWVVFGLPIIVWKLHSFRLAVPLRWFVCRVRCSNMKLCICTVPRGGGGGGGGVVALL
jgi:hypothetical protein